MRKRTCITKCGITTYILRAGFAFLLMCLAGSEAFALDPMGPPTASLRLDELMIGFNYTSSSMDVELNNGEWNEYYEGSLYDAGEAESFKLKDFDMNKIYANIGYGLWDNCEIYLRLGGVSTEFGDSIWEAGEKFESNTNFSFCIGSKATFYEIGDLKIGRLIQLSWANMDGDLKAPQWTEADSVEMDLMEIQVAIGPAFTSPNGSSIYGGPFFHFVDGEIKDKYTLASGINTEYTWDIDESSTFGGYIGTQLYFSENSYLNIEYQHTSGASAVGLSFTWEF
ncbi:MAG: hypothetical protein JW715_16180 [Sedimentisphaerales bacterium]|nr:hypothetical protein [Sedimentisphaerales bacterium]